MKSLKKKTQQLQNRIKELLKKYIKLLHLEQWEIDVVLSKDDLLKVKCGKVKRVSPDYFAEVIYEYLVNSATLIITKLQTVDKPEELEDTILHELLHIKLASIMQTTDSLIGMSGLKKEKIEALTGDIDSKEHEIIETFIQIILKREKKNGK